MFGELRLCKDMIFAAKGRPAGLVLVIRKHMREGQLIFPCAKGAPE
jgi:hypothetical protein